MKSNVKFDFTKIKKRAAGVPAMILTPTIHMSIKGEISFYCIAIQETPYFRIVKTGDLIGLEFSKTPFGNSFKSRERGSAYTATACSVVKEIGLEKYLGTDFNSGNFALQKDSDNLYWFDLPTAVTKYKKLK